MSLPSTLSNEEKLARHQLIRTSSVGPITFKHLLGRYGSGVQALEAIPDLAAKGNRKKPLEIAPAGPIIKELKALKTIGGQSLHIGDGDYPKRLAQVEDSPPILFAKGHTHLLNKDCVGIVGARNASASGMRLTQSIAADLSENEYVVSSGLARGIDTIAHKASLKGGTIACLAGGLDIIYPKENDALYDAIAETGVILSEMKLSTKPQARHFPRRNRIISGLSLGILVIEAAEKSGSLITAKYAAEQGREVFAIPGSPADPRARGTNKLIKDGAVLVQDASDILNELNGLRNLYLNEPSDEMPLFQAASGSDDISHNERENLITLLSPTPVGIDDIIRLSEMPAGVVLSVILELELAGKAIRYPGNRVSLLANSAENNDDQSELFS